MTFERVKEHPKGNGIFLRPKPKRSMMRIVKDSVSDKDIIEVKKVLFKELRN